MSRRALRRLRGEQRGQEPIGPSALQFDLRDDDDAEEEGPKRELGVRRPGGAGKEGVRVNNRFELVVLCKWGELQYLRSLPYIISEGRAITQPRGPGFLESSLTKAPEPELSHCCVQRSPVLAFSPIQPLTLTLGVPTAGPPTSHSSYLSISVHTVSNALALLQPVFPDKH